MFDNHSAHGDAPPKASRVLVVDVATGEERVVFPGGGGGGGGSAGQWHSRESGHVSLSPGGARALVSYSRMGKALESGSRTVPCSPSSTTFTT